MRKENCFWCGEEVYVDDVGFALNMYKVNFRLVKGYVCCMAPECVGAVVMEIDELEEYKQWKESEDYDGMNLIEYVEAGGYDSSFIIREEEIVRRRGEPVDKS